MILGRVNVLRNAMGKPSLNRIWCPLCRSENLHNIWNCPNLKCPICGQQHLIINCPYAIACQWCGSRTHSSELCNDVQGRLKKVQCYNRCLKCGRVGHVARYCQSRTRLNRRRRRRRYRRRRYRRRRRY